MRDKALPVRPVTGDRIRLRPERMKAYEVAAKLAGYDFDLYAVRTVTRVDGFAPGGGERLFVNGAPHCFLPRDVNLAWNTDGERREMLLAAGWRVDEKSGDLLKPKPARAA
jgi:hypothetical protein